MFWGLVTINEFAYRFTQSVAKFELMVLDIPRIEYLSDKEQKNTTKNDSKDTITINPNDKAFELNAESIRKARARKQNQLDTENEGWTKINLSDLTKRQND